MALFTCAVLTVSDTCVTGEKEDVSGKELVKVLASNGYSLLEAAVVADEQKDIIKKLNDWVDKKINLILTTGGTGLSPRDVTPEATKSIIDKQVPGIVHAMISKGLNITPMASLSRAEAGIKNKSLIINLPGSKKGVLECFSFIKDCLPHALSVLCDNRETIVKEHNEIQRETSKVDIFNVADRPRISIYPMLEVEQALDLIIKESHYDVSCETVRIENGLHRVLAQDIISKEDLPYFDASIKDGYAVLSADGAGSRNVRRFVAAGDSPEKRKLVSGEAIRINTGGVIPLGADAVVQVEDTSVLEKANGEELKVTIHKAPLKGQDIRLAGSDLQTGSQVFQKGDRLGFSHLGVLSSLGQSNILVYKLPAVAIFTTGDELKEHFQKIKPGQIRDSNRLALINLLKEYHYKCCDYGIVKDDPVSTKTAIMTALENNDVLITTGGVSMGEFDFIKRVLVEDFEAKIHFGRVNMKPGKPTTFATFFLNGIKKIVFGLPGNPVSACVTCLLFVIPMLRHLEGARQWGFTTIPYDTEINNKDTDPRPEFIRVIVRLLDGKVVATSNGGQISSRLNSLVGANGLMLRRGNKTSNIILFGDLLTE